MCGGSASSEAAGKPATLVLAVPGVSQRTVHMHALVLMD